MPVEGATCPCLEDGTTVWSTEVVEVDEHTVDVGQQGTSELWATKVLL